MTDPTPNKAELAKQMAEMQARMKKVEEEKAKKKAEREAAEKEAEEERKSKEREDAKKVEEEKEKAEREAAAGEEKTEEKKPEPEPKAENKEKKSKKLSPEEEVADFVEEFDLKDLLPKEFAGLTPEQKLLTIKDVQRRIVDIVKTDAQTQYSDYLKSKMVASTGGTNKFTKALSGIKAGAQNLGTTLWEGIKKETKLKNIESDTFKKLRASEDGKLQIATDLEQLTKRNAGREVLLDKEGKPYVGISAETLNIDLDQATMSEKADIEEFQQKAAAFRNMPYEWGQEEKAFIGGNKKKYEEAKKEYEEARSNILKIKTRLEEKAGLPKGKAMIEVLQMDNALKLDQILNTHPEFEQAILDLEKTASGKEYLKTTGNFFQTITGGKNQINKLAFALGFGTRTVTKYGAIAFGGTMATAIGAIAAPVIGASFGYWRGKIKANQTLREKSKDARHGKKDTTAEREKMADSVKLYAGLDKMIKKVESASTPEDKGKLLAKLTNIIDYTQYEIENGSVNFGDAKSLVSNQFNLINNLNQAIVLRETLNDKIDKVLEEKIETLLYRGSKKSEKRHEKTKNEFISKQALQTAKIGAGFAAVGYGVRWAGEAAGWWGDDAAKAAEATDTEIEVKEEVVPTAEELAKADSASAKTAQEFFKTDTVVVDKEKIIPIDTGDGNPEIEVKEPEVGDSTNAEDANTREDSLLNEKKGDLQKVIEEPDAGKEAAEKAAKEATEKAAAAAALANAEEAAKKAAKKAAENILERGIDVDFSVALGKNGVPPNLETVFNQISASYMELPESGVIDEEFATKSLNMAANLVRLTEGHNVIGIDAKDFADVASYKDGILEIKDHIKFNEALEKLNNHSDELWGKGMLQGKGGAISYISKLSDERWLEIAHAKGLHEDVDGVATGVDGHPEVTAEDIKDFDKSEMVQKATVPHVGKWPPEDILKYDNAYDITAIDPRTGLAETIAEGAGENTLTESGEKTAEELLKEKIEQARLAEEAAKSTGEGAPTEIKPENPDEVPGAGTIEDLSGNNPYNLSEKLLRKVDRIYENNTENLFPKNPKLWDTYAVGPAENLVKMAEYTEGVGNDESKILFSQIYKLSELTHVEPLPESPIHGAETLGHWFKRALQKAAEMDENNLDKFKL